MTPFLRLFVFGPVALAWVCVLAALEPASGQILYVKPVGTGAQQVGQLRQVNADGTGDTAVAVPFADVLGPVPERNGNRFALSAVDPARPNQISRNVFTVNRTTGAIQNATNFLDMLDPDTLLYTYVYGFYKAFSPDGTLIAVNSYYRIRRLTPGAYTAVVQGKDGGTGVGLVEAYGLDGTATLANISTRGLVQTGDNVMIGGFIVLDTGAGATNMIVRAIGPSLNGVTGALADPVLELHDSNGALVASNDNGRERKRARSKRPGWPRATTMNPRS